MLKLPKFPIAMIFFIFLGVNGRYTFQLQIEDLCIFTYFCLKNGYEVIKKIF